MSFIVDGAEWIFDDFDEEGVRVFFERILSLVEVSHFRDEIIWIGEDFQYRKMLGDLDLWSMFGPSSPINVPMEIQQELAAWLNFAPYYMVDMAWPEGIEDSEVSINSEDVAENIDVAWVHHSVRAGSGIACISFRRSGFISTQTKLGDLGIFFVSCEKDRLDFWRSEVRLRGNNLVALQRFSTHSYPDILFYGDSLSDARKLAGGFNSMSDLVQNSLEVLNDFGKWIFNCPPPSLTPAEVRDDAAIGYPTNQMIEDRFRGFGLIVAPENPNVFLNAICRRAREVTIGEGVIYCEWHVKLEPHRNRIHFHKPLPASGDKLVIAFIGEHLPLP